MVKKLRSLFEKIEETDIIALSLISANVKLRFFLLLLINAEALLVFYPLSGLLVFNDFTIF